MDLITKESLEITEKDIDTIVAEAVNVYLEMKHEKNNISDFYECLRTSHVSKSVNLEEFRSFFNRRLVLDYIMKNKIDILSLSKEVNQDLKKEISKSVLENVTRVDGKISLASDNLDFSSCKNSFYFNIPNDYLISSLSNLYTLVNTNSVPYLIEINRDLNNYSDSIVLKTPNVDEKTIDVINQFASMSQDILILPMRVTKRVIPSVGYAYDGYLENIYSCLIEAIDELVSKGEVINNVERFNRIKGIQYSIEERKKLEVVFKDKLMNTLIKTDEMVIDVQKPTVEFETFVNDINTIDKDHEELDIFLNEIPEVKTESLDVTPAESTFPEIDEIIDHADEHVVLPTSDNIVEDYEVKIPDTFPEIDRIIEEADKNFAKSQTSEDFELNKNNEPATTDKFEFASQFGDVKESSVDSKAQDVEVKIPDMLPEVDRIIEEADKDFAKSQTSEDFELNKVNEPATTDKFASQFEKTTPEFDNNFTSPIKDVKEPSVDELLVEIPEVGETIPEVTPSQEKVTESLINDPGLNSVIENTPLSHEELTSVVKNLEENDAPRIERAQKYANFVDEISTLNRPMIGSNGDNTTLLDYLDDENVLSRIPLDADILLEDGQMIKGNEFIKTKLIPYALEVGNSNIDVVMNAYGARIVEKQEKVGLFKRFFG